MIGPHARYRNVVGALSCAAVPVRELHGCGHVAVTPAAARIVAMSFTADAPNLFWSNPQLHDSDLLQHQPKKLVGGFGGDRLWFAPELDYHWLGRPDWNTLANYRVAPQADPGTYRFVEAEKGTIRLCAKIQLPIRSTGRCVSFEVERTIRLTPPPLGESDPSMKGIEYVGIETSHLLKFDRTTQQGRVDLWHLLQLPVGSVLIVPLKRAAGDASTTPLSYGMPGDWVQEPDRILWRYGGEARAKFGLAAHALTGRAAVLRELEPDYQCLIVREFAVDEKVAYADHPYGVPRTDQAFQAWDGLGFGEMEYHSPMLDAERGPRELRESDRLWAFGGSSRAIAQLAARLLSLDLDALSLE